MDDADGSGDVMPPTPAWDPPHDGSENALVSGGLSGGPRRGLSGGHGRHRLAIVLGSVAVLGALIVGLSRLNDEPPPPEASESVVVATTEPAPPATEPPPLVASATTSSTTVTMASTTTVPPDAPIDESAAALPIDTVTDDGPDVTAPDQSGAEPAVVARPVPVEPPAPPPQAPAPPWAATRSTTAGGHVSTDVGCALDSSPAALDLFLAERVGPVLGWDYQHVYDLGDGRQLWLFQDTFLDHSGTAQTLDKANFVHNSAMVQDGACFRLLHRGTPSRPTPFELGTGTTTLRTWFWPMGGEVHNGQLHVFWAEMVKDAVDPTPPDGLGWHPVATHVATYDPATMARLDFRRAPNSGATPIYGYAVSSDATHTYLFGNTFEQNMTREGGWFNGPHSGTLMFLARVPRGELLSAPEYWRPEGWDPNPAGAQPFLRRHWAEFPMQPRFIGGQWAATTAVNGFWGEEFEVDVAPNPWGPWTTVEQRALLPRGFDPKMNTYHAHLHPRLDGSGNLVVSVSNNARDMLRDAWPNPYRYRPVVFSSLFQSPPPPTTTPATTATPTTIQPSTVPATTVAPTTAPPPTTVPPSTTPSTSSTTLPTSTTTLPTTTTTTTSTTTTSTSTSTTTVSPTSTTTPSTTTSTTTSTNTSTTTTPTISAPAVTTTVPPDT